MASEHPNPPRKIPAYGWVLLALIVGLNLWYDYYHPLGWLFDVVIIIAVLFKRSRS